MNLNTAGWASPLLRLLARLDSDGPNSTTPVTEINGGNISATNADIALVAKGTGATLAQVPDGTTAGGNKRGTYATDWQRVRVVSVCVASGPYSTISGGQSNTASGSNATVGGGREHAASGADSAIAGGWGNNAGAQYSFIGGGQSNTASTNTHATVCGGNSNTASGLYALVGGGARNTASGNHATIAGGVDCVANTTSATVGGGNTNQATANSSTVCGGAVNTASAFDAVVAGGATNIANAESSAIPGGRRGTTRGIIGCFVVPACNIPIADVAGVTQSALLLLGRETTNATATVLASNGSAAAATNQVTLPNNSAYSFSGEVIAGVTGAGNSARWTIDGAIKRGANAGTTTMIGTPTVVMSHFDAGAATWVVAVTADTTNGAITVTVTGAAATTIRWVAKIETTEMTF
jgi:hypothetical protein